MTYSYLSAFVIAVFSSLVLTRYIRDMAVRRGWVFSPPSSRHLHTRPVPRLGGAAIFLAFMVVMAVATLVKPSTLRQGSSIPQILGVLGPASVVFLLGLYDDIRSVSPYFKFGVQAVAATLLYLNGYGISRLTVIPGGDHVGHLLGFALTILWVLWITNAFNLIDGLDGLAAGAALFSTLVVFVSLVASEANAFAFITVVLAGATAGFLRYNFNPATIFLGDAGSLFIGFLLSAIALAGSQKSPTIIAVAIPVVSLGLPVLDVAVAVIRRFLNGKPLFGADQEHIHHQLLKRGFSQRQAVLILYGVSAVFGLISLFLLRGGESVLVLTLVILGFAVFLGLQQLRYHEVSEIQRVVDRAWNQKQIIASNLRIRKAAEALAECQTLPEVHNVLAEALKCSGFDALTIKLKDTSDSNLERSAVLLNMPQDGRGDAWLLQSEEFESAWSLSLGLCDGTHEIIGSFAVHRSSTDKPLTMDINVFSTSGFCTALAEAMQRVVKSARPYLNKPRLELVESRFLVPSIAQSEIPVTTGQ